MAPELETIDIYDAQRNRTGKVINRDDAFLSEGEYMLYVLAIIQDKANRILITQRALDKHWAPGAWEIPGGGVAAGETPEQSVVREVREEVGLDVSDMLAAPVHSYENVDLERGDNYIVDFFHFCLDVTEDDVVLQESESIAFRFATWEEICALATDNKFLHFTRLRDAVEALNA